MPWKSAPSFKYWDQEKGCPVHLGQPFPGSESILVLFSYFLSGRTESGYHSPARCFWALRASGYPESVWLPAAAYPVPHSGKAWAFPPGCMLLHHRSSALHTLCELARIRICKVRNNFTKGRCCLLLLHIIKAGSDHSDSHIIRFFSIIQGTEDNIGIFSGKILYIAALHRWHPSELISPDTLMMTWDAPLMVVSSSGDSTAMLTLHPAALFVALAMHRYQYVQCPCPS